MMVIFMESLSLDEYLRIQMLCSTTYFTTTNSHKGHIQISLFCPKNQNNIIKHLRRIGNLNSFSKLTHRVRRYFWESKLLQGVYQDKMVKVLGNKSYE